MDIKTKFNIGDKVWVWTDEDKKPKNKQKNKPKLVEITNINVSVGEDFWSINYSVVDEDNWFNSLHEYDLFLSKRAVVEANSKPNAW